MKKIKMKHIMTLVLVIVMSVAATSTAFARGFGGGRMVQERRQAIECECPIRSEYENCPFYYEGSREARQRGQGRGFGACRRLQ